MSTGKFKRYFAVILSLVMVLGLLPGITRPAKALEIYLHGKTAGSEYSFSSSSIYDEATLQTAYDSIGSIGFTRPAAVVDGVTCYGEVGFLPNNYINLENYGQINGMDIYGNNTYYFIAYTAGTYHFQALADWDDTLVRDIYIEVDPGCTTPTVTTNDATSLSSSGATLNGTVNPNNGSTSVIFFYGLDTGYGTEAIASQSPISGSTDTAVSYGVTGLKPNTLYHYKVFATNSAGTADGGDKTFTTNKAAPAATTNAANPITSTGATLSGTVNASNESTAVTFEYGTSTSYGSTATATQSPVTGTSDTSVSYELAGLTPNTTYHYRVVAVNPTGTANGSDLTFTTQAVAPTVATGSASGIASTGATVAGTVNANNASTTAAFEYGLDTSYGLSMPALQSPVTGTGNTDVSAVLYELLPNTTYHFRATGVNAGGTANGSDATFTTAKAKPVAITDDTCILGTFGTTVHAMVNANNDDTTVTFEYGLTSSYGASVSAVPGTVTGSNGKVVKGDLAGLTPNTTYHFRVVAVNSAGKTEGSDEIFTTLAEYPAVTTGSASDIVPTGATLNGSVIANNTDTAVTFQYGLDTSYGSSVSAVPGTATGMGNTDVSAALTDLLPNTTYHFRAVGVNAAGPANGSDASFTTGRAKPTATTGTAGGLSSSGATLNGTVNASNENTTVTFEYGLSTSYGATATATPSTATGSDNTSVSCGLSGLLSNTTYHYRVVAANPTGTTNGLDQTFTTLAVAPTVTTGSAGSITSSAATLHGTVNANNADTSVTFQYGLTTAYGSTITASPDTVTGMVGTSVSAALSGLDPNTTYHFRAVGVNAGGTTQGSDATFTTGAVAPVAVTSDADSITPTGATLHGTVNAKNASTTVSFEYGLTTAYGTIVPAAESPAAGLSDTLVSKAITGLNPNTTYHYRVIAVNSAGTTQSMDKTFTTPLKPAAILAADTSSNDVDHPLEITFTADTAFEGVITAITYGGKLLTESTDYTVSSGKITLIPAGNNAELQKPGTANLVISATGYYDSSVSQTITAGAAAAMEVTTQPVPGVNSGDVFATQPQVAVKDQYGNICADGPSSSAAVIAAPKPGIPGSGSWGIGGTDTVNAVNGIISFSDLTCDLTAPGESAMVFLPGPDISGIPQAESNTFTIPLRQAVAFTADTSDNSVDHEINIDYGSASGFASAISSITFGGVSLTEGTDYEVYKDAIALKPAGGNPVLRKPATALLVVKAAGFRDSSVTQTITAGEVASLTVSTEPQPGQNSGDAFLTQPVVILKDQYGNTCADGLSAAADVTVSAAKGTGTWDIGGTVTRAAVSGVATFDGLTCTQVSYGTGAIEFTSGLVTCSSAVFDLPLKAAVTLAADSSDNSVDHEISIDYGPASGFANAISSITFGGVSLIQGTDYEVYKDAIVLKPAGGNPVLRKPATALLVVKAAGFRDSSVTQIITAGEVAVLTVGTEPKPGVSSGDAFAVQPIVILKDQYGNICTDGLSASAKVTAAASAGTGKWTIGGTVLKAAVNGTAVFAGLTATQLDPGTGAVRFTAGAASGTSLAFDLPLKSPVILYPAVSGNSVDNAIEIIFPANADFEKKVTSVKIGGTALVPDTDYTVTSGKITLKPAGGNAALRKPGTLSVTVSSAGYKESTASQAITAGTVASIDVITQPVPGKVSGDAFATQPKVTLYDRYGNVCVDGPSSSALVAVSAAADTGTWTIGGAASRLAVNGVAAFAGLTSVNVMPGMGKMNFTCEAFTVSSASFAIPERNASVTAVSARFDKYAESGNNKNITVTLALNGNTLDAIKNGTAALAPNTDYTVNGDTAVIKKDYLAKQPKGTVKLTFDFSQGTDPVLSITVSDTTPASSSDGTPAVNVIVNGEGQDAGSVNTTEKDGKTETIVTVDNGKLQQILDSKGNNASVVIPVTTGSSVSSVVMNGQMMSALQISQATLKVQTETSTYTLPSDGLDMGEVAKELGENVPKDEVKVNITISEPPAETVQVVEDAAEEGNFAIVVPAVEFKVECSYKEQTVEVKNFNAYVERTIAIPDGVDPYKITTAVVVRPDGTTYHVPTKITVIDGKYYAVINSLTNSTYTVIWHPVAYEDMRDHWAKEAVNDMGSRMVVTGVDEKNYMPDEQITRADFVADVVRALGLNPGEGENPYADVKETDWYYGYVKAAAAYGLLVTDGTAPFAAQETVSREEAMAMIDNAMKIAKMEIMLEDEEVKALLQAYGDGMSVSEANKQSAAACLKAEVTFDLKEGLQPKTPVTRAEAAVILRLLLQKAKLI